MKSSTSEHEYLSYLLILRHHAVNVTSFRSGYCCTMWNSNELIVQPHPTATITNSLRKEAEEVSTSSITAAMVLQLVNKFQTFYWPPKVCYCVDSSPLCIPILPQMNPDHALLPHFFSIHFNIILPHLHLNLLGFLVCCFPPNKVLCICVLHACHIPQPCHYPRFDSFHNIQLEEQIMKLLITQFLQTPGTF